MNVPVMRNRTGSSRADFVGVDPRQPSPSPSDLLGRRFSELSAEQQLLHDWAKQLSEFRGPKFIEDDDPPSVLLEGCRLTNYLDIITDSSVPESKKEIITVMLPFLMVPVHVSPDITLDQLKTQIFIRLKKSPITGFKWDSSNYVFKCVNKDTAEMEAFYHEDVRLYKLPYSKVSPTLFLYPREGQHAEKELSRQLSIVLGYSLEHLETLFTVEHKESRAKFWLVANDSTNKNQYGLRYFAYPEEIYWPPSQEGFMTTTFASKIKSGRLHYELFYCSRDNEESGKFDQHSFAEVEFDPHLTPDGLIEKALKEMKNNGHNVDEKDKYVLQLAGKRSFLTGNKRLVVNYLKIRSSLENYKNPNFVLRRVDVLLSHYAADCPMNKPHYVKVEESRMESERESECDEITSIWNVDEQLYIKPCSYSMFEAHRDPNATVVCVFTFYVGKAVIAQYASKEASLKNPRWDRNPIYTDFYIKDIPESLSMCIQLYELVRKDRPKKSTSKKDGDSSKKGKLDDDSKKGLGEEDEGKRGKSEESVRRVKGGDIKKGKAEEDGKRGKVEDDMKRAEEEYAMLLEMDKQSVISFNPSIQTDFFKLDQEEGIYKGWPEFLTMIREYQNDEKTDKKDDKIAITCVGWYHVPLFNWRKRLHFRTYTFPLWAGEPELGKSNMCETKGDRKSNYRVTVEISLSKSSRSKNNPQTVQAVEDTRWADLFPVTEDRNFLQRPNDQIEKRLKEIRDTYYRRIKQGYIEMTDEFVAHLWDLRYFWAKACSDALLLLIEHREMWLTRERFGEIYQMIFNQKFEFLSLQTCIAILASSNGDRIIRSFAAECTDRLLEDRNMPLYILPLIQSLKTEPWVYSTLSCMLLKRSLRNWKIGHKVFWLLRSELMLLRDSVGPDNKLFKSIAILLEAYLRGNEERLPSFVKQVTMVDLMNKMTLSVKSFNSHEAATKKLREELREQCTLLENLDSPLDTTAFLGELVIDKCKVLGSAKVPLKLCWKNPLPFAEYYLTHHEIIFKSGDDLRQDMLVLQMIEVMEECWTNAGMDCCLSIYPVLPTGKMIGMIGVVPNSRTIFQIQSEGGKIGTAVNFSTSFLNKYVRSNAVGGKEYLEGVERFTMSCVGYSVATYVMGIKDRHNDNIMVSNDGKLFHIDFGHILGHGKKKLGIQRDRVPFVLVEQFLCVIGKGQQVVKDSKEIQQFRKTCELAYRRIFGYRHLFVSIFTAMKQMELPELSTERDLDHVRKTLQVFSESESEAGAFFDEIFEEALNGSWSTKTNWFFHTVKHL